MNVQLLFLLGFFRRGLLNILLEHSQVYSLIIIMLMELKCDFISLIG